MHKKDKLSARDRAIIGAMQARGDRIQDVAYWFGISPSTVHSIKKKYLTKGQRGTAQTNSAELPDRLPPRGPYEIVQKAALIDMAAKAARVDEAEAQRRAARLLVEELKGLVQKYENCLLNQTFMGQKGHSTQLMLPL